MRNGFSLIGAVALLVAGLGAGSAFSADLPPAADKKVDFKADIWPIFQASCIKCHGPEKKKSGLRMHTKEEAMKGGSAGPMVVPGKSAESLIIKLVTGTSDDFDKMPSEGDPLTDAQIGLLRAWIDQGAAWPDDFATPPLDGAPAPAPEKTAAPGETPTTGSAAGMNTMWIVQATQQDGPLATWEVSKEVKSPAGDPAFGLVKTNHTSAKSLNLLWLEKAKIADSSVDVMLKASGGVQEQGGGILWRAKDKDNFYGARYNPLQKNFRVYKVVNGEREQLASADCKPEKEWVSLHVEQRGGHYKAVLDGTTTLEGDDATLAEPGGVGFWTEADATTFFGDAAMDELK